METIGVYKDIPLTADPISALVFAIIGWVIVIGILVFALNRWYKKPVEVVEKS